MLIYGVCKGSGPAQFGRTAGEPKVGFTNFDADDWPQQIRSWDSFDDFFSELRLYQSL